MFSSEICKIFQNTFLKGICRMDAPKDRVRARLD